MRHGIRDGVICGGEHLQENPFGNEYTQCWGCQHWAGVHVCTFEYNRDIRCLLCIYGCLAAECEMRKTMKES